MDDKINFVHLHVHTEYSLLDGANRIKELVKKVKELGMRAVAITDHGAMYGAVEFYKECMANGVKPIIGCEVYQAPRTRFDKESGIDDKLGHLILLAKDNVGYKNLIKIVSSSFTEGYYYKPRVDLELLRKHSEGLICTSACLAGFMSRAILEDDIDKAKEIAKEYIDIFGKDNFYIELQSNGIEEQVLVNQNLIRIARSLDVPLIATNDAHYLNKEDSYSHEVLLCVQTGKKITDEDRFKFGSDEFYVKSPEEMSASFKSFPDAISNTGLIADRCNVTFEFGHTILPNFDVPNNEDHFNYLQKLCYDGLIKKYKLDIPMNISYDEKSNMILKLRPDLYERLVYELSVISKMGYIDYFLIVWDFIKYAKDNDIPVGPGRGSGAGSICAYAIDITDVDPMKFNLVFERFLNPERVSMPDFDVDFCVERRGEVIDYVCRKYGNDHVAQIITFGTMAARAVIRDVARVLNITYAKADSIAKQVPMEHHMTLEKALSINPELKMMYEQDEEVKLVIDISKRLEGLPRHASTHAAGVVITKEPVDTYVPLYKNDGLISTQYTMTILEELGLLKMDFLGLRTLTVIKDTLDIIKENKNIDVEFDSKMDDPLVYKLWADGNTSGVFQFESSGMIAFMRELKPDRIEDLIAGVSLYRPGPMDQIPRYIKAKLNPGLTAYTHPALEPILNVTYGCMVYQEQVMQIVRDIGGYSLGRADLVRRAMGKKKLDVMAEERKNFIYGVTDEEGNVLIPGAIRNGVDEKSANKIFDEMAEFAKYAFNKAHAACYAVVAYRTAFLKTYYKAEFFAALLNSFLSSLNKISEYITECKKLNLEIIRPDVNKSFSKFTVVGDAIVFGLAAIKNVGEAAIEAITKERSERGEYKDFIDFCKRTSSLDVNKKCIESMIKAGAFDSLGTNRESLLCSFENILDRINSDMKKSLSGQVNMFEVASKDLNNESIYQIANVPEMNRKVLLSLEKEVLGLYLSGHPLDSLTNEIEEYSNIKTTDLFFDEESESLNVKDSQAFKMIGIITSIRTKLTKNGDQMAFVSVQDLYGESNMIAFAKTFAQYRPYLYEDNIIKIEGRINVKADEISVVILKVKKIEAPPNIQTLQLNIPGNLSVNELQNLREIVKALTNQKGDAKLIITNNNVIKDFSMHRDEILLSKLKELVGEENLREQ